ncbi:hypothetical protein C2G38_2155183 [Gigaspora rosea]|uniref:Uncharacterized protein n=1 Tax=Gigaspora rosea TaxID=44941 RepID=A0A397W6A8_9GLOM|nr:hypothetical protein C2G38_2155183 [Gigaspora rosea]
MAAPERKQIRNLKATEYEKIQFKATEYGVVVEWIPFNRLVNIQKTSESESGSAFLATWLDVQGWTNGNEQIDEYIKEFQLKATEYDNVIK